MFHFIYVLLLIRMEFKLKLVDKEFWDVVTFISEEQLFKMFIWFLHASNFQSINYRTLCNYCSNFLSIEMSLMFTGIWRTWILNITRSNDVMNLSLSYSTSLLFYKSTKRTKLCFIFLNPLFSHDSPTLLLQRPREIT